MSKDKDTKMSRADFFRSGRRRMFDTLKQVVSAGTEAFEEVQRPPAARPRVQRTAALHGLLRPPGALPEGELLDTCRRSGRCVDACPPLAIFAAPEQMGDIVGTPVIKPDRMACLLCPDVPCATACPSGALSPVPVESIRLGLAGIDRALCLSWTGTDCHLCTNACPESTGAIIEDPQGRPSVSPQRCTGCGQCVPACPTTPRAMLIIPMTNGTVRR